MFFKLFLKSFCFVLPALWSSFGVFEVACFSFVSGEFAEGAKPLFLVYFITLIMFTPFCKQNLSMLLCLALCMYSIYLV